MNMNWWKAQAEYGHLCLRCPLADCNDTAKSCLIRRRLARHKQRAAREQKQEQMIKDAILSILLDLPEKKRKKREEGA
jgi:hypothetical protein